MTDTSDFETFAQRLSDQLFETVDGADRPRDHDPDENIIIDRPWYVEQLRRAWNARGAADIETVNAAYVTAPLDHVIDALRSLDR